MSFKLKIKLLIVLAVCITASLAAGCKIGEMTMDEYLNKNQASDQCVTYFGNGGIFNGINSQTQMDIYFQADSYIVNTDNTTGFKVERTNYNFDAWYYCSADDEGNPVCDGDGNIILGDKVLSTDRVAANSHLYVVANWNTNVALEIWLKTDGFSVEADGKTYAPDTILSTKYFGNFSVYGLTQSTDAVKAENGTFLAFFEDEECTKPISQVVKPADNNADNVKVYAKYLEGDWTVVSNTTAIRTMFNSTDAGEKFYLFTTDGRGVLNYDSSATISLKSSATVTDKIIEGNGVTIENLKFATTGTSSEYSIFGTIGENAVIKNLILKDVTVTATVRSDLNLYLVNSAIQSGAEIEGLEFENVEFGITAASGAKILNILLADGTFKTDSWLFGGYDTDDEFIEEVGGIKITDASLIFNKELIAENVSK